MSFSSISFLKKWINWLKYIEYFDYNSESNIKQWEASVEWNISTNNVAAKILDSLITTILPESNILSEKELKMYVFDKVYNIIRHLFSALFFLAIKYWKKIIA